MAAVALCVAACHDQSPPPDASSGARESAAAGATDELAAGILREVQRALDELETEDPFMMTDFASGISDIRRIILGLPAVKTLLTHEDLAIQDILIRRRGRGDRATSMTRISWYLIFESAGDRRAIDPILEDLRALPDDDLRHVHAPGSIFPHAIAALRKLCPEADLGDDLEVLFRDRAHLDERCRDRSP